MANMLYTGVFGAGKTYTVVSDLYDLLQKDKDVFVIHNIDDLRSESFGSDRIHTFEDLGIDLNRFTFAQFEDLCSQARDKNSRCLFIVDEAHDYLTKLNDHWRQIIAKHRKKTADLWLITQDLKQLDSRVIISFEYRVDNPFISLPGWVRLKKRIQGEIIGSRWVKKRKAIFALYSSFDGGGGEKSKQSGSVMLKYFVIGGILLIVAVFGFFRTWTTPKVLASPIHSTPVKPVSSLSSKTSLSPTTKNKPLVIPSDAEYTLSGCLDSKALLQTSDGHLTSSDRVWPDSIVVECVRSQCSLLIKGKEKKIYHQIGFVKRVESQAETTEPGRDTASKITKSYWPDG